jgi:hypothetical protein
LAYKVSWNKGVGKDFNQIPISAQKRIIEKVEALLANDPLNQGQRPIQDIVKAAVREGLKEMRKAV